MESEREGEGERVITATRDKKLQMRHGGPKVTNSIKTKRLETSISQIWCAKQNMDHQRPTAPNREIKLQKTIPSTSK